MNSDSDVRKNSIPAYFDDLLKILMAWRGLGFEKDSLGGIHIGKVPHVAPLAVLHHVFGPLTDEQIDEMGDSINCYLPKDVRTFYGLANGLGLFSDCIGMYGLRKTMKRTGSTPMTLPYNIVVPNVLERPVWLARGEVIIGYYGYDGAKVSVSPNGQVSSHDPKDGRGAVTSTWSDLPSWLLSESSRLSKDFDEEGRLQIDESCLSPR